MEQLQRNFFTKKTEYVAENLLWKILQVNEYFGIINEVESYWWLEDPASHAFN